MKPYARMQKECRYGHYNPDKAASYTLTHGEELNSPWYYIYNNRKILLYVDQNGPVKIQYQPPNGILAVKREIGENQSKWQVWVQSDDLNNGIAVSNFNSPKLCCTSKKPKFSVTWNPEKAVYKSQYENLDIITEIFVPTDKATVCMKTNVVNNAEEPITLTVTPAFFPYLNIPQMVPWDLPEWYLATKVIKKDAMLTFHGQMTSPEGDKNLNRSATFSVDYDENAQIELDMAPFCGNGNFFCPNSVADDKELSMKMSDAEGHSFTDFQAVYAAKYKFTLNPGQSKTLTQVLTIQEDVEYNTEENLYDLIYFDKDKYKKSVEKAADFYAELFSKRTVKTENELYNNFINSFVPLQMFWVCSLDRGWPSSMRGIRDCSQDFIGMLPLDTKWTKDSIAEMFSHQQRDGWMPRQISTISREAPHDMRYYCDGGAFLLELVHEYLTFTRDTDMLFKKVYWLDSDEKSTILEHIVSCTQFYLEEKNIGEHGLCKVWYGDWWDPMDKIGMDARGETVTVTAQMVVNLKNLAALYHWLVSMGKADKKYLRLAEKYLDKSESFKNALRKYAYNDSGYFNGYFNDNGKWLLSDNDPDGEKRVYLVSNAWAIISGSATREMQKSVIGNIERECLGRVGYNTSSKGFPVYIDKAGRKGNGSSPGTGSYNHAQSFFVRACCECGESELAYKATKYILPISEYNPVEKTYAPPFSIANCYSNGDAFPHRAELQYLSGTVSYVLRTVYNFFFGITFTYEGLILKPCIPKAFGNCSVKFTYLGKNFEIEFKQSSDDSHSVTLNSKTWNTSMNDKNGRIMAEFFDSDFEAENYIVFEY